MTSNVNVAYVGLGANLGDPISQLLCARKHLLASQKVIAGRTSSFYLSSPVGYSDQPNFVNCVLELKVSCTYRELFDLMQSIESIMGRVRFSDNQNAARLIDLDLLLFGDASIDESDLIVPHPRMHERLFVLVPLHELSQELAKKHSNNRLSNTVSEFKNQALFKLAL